MGGNEEDELDAAGWEDEVGMDGAWWREGPPKVGLNDMLMRGGVQLVVRRGRSRGTRRWGWGEQQNGRRVGDIDSFSLSSVLMCSIGLQWVTVQMVRRRQAALSRLNERECSSPPHRASI